MSSWTSIKGAGRTPGTFIGWQLAVIESYMTRRALGCAQSRMIPCPAVQHRVSSLDNSRVYAASSAAELSFFSALCPARDCHRSMLIFSPLVHPSPPRPSSQIESITVQVRAAIPSASTIRWRTQEATWSIECGTVRSTYVVAVTVT